MYAPPVNELSSKTTLYQLPIEIRNSEVKSKKKGDFDRFPVSTCIKLRFSQPIWIKINGGLSKTNDLSSKQFLTDNG